MAVFFELVEIRTKLASVFPYFIGLLFSSYYFEQINWFNMFLFFIGMFIFDMATTAINNLMDYLKAKDDSYQQLTNIIGRAGLKVSKVRNMIIGMITFSSIIGLWLTFRTSLLLLPMGGLCFLIGIFYTFGPVPLSRMPLGELFSGVTMGFGIFFITLYLNVYDTGFLALKFANGQFMLSGNIKELIVSVWASIPMMFTIANIMLANNLCDLDQDILNHRYTLPFYIGRQNGVYLFDLLMYSCYFVIVIGVMVGIYHWSMLIILVTFPLVKKNVSQFNEKQEKGTTFSVAIKNLVLFNGAQITGLLLGIILTK
ncbi:MULTISPECIES: 1,4-dihydroxy-2-naphthoate polyprenyltransferase [Vagococcus]|uniref:1,4-dihydroxy-2-naphthoate polyprenyltransferase n=1 Tax=Vagococcus TaxID=2737 RepID=UPI000E4D3FE1|nr:MULTISPECIES: 1,4-dihydroxy-2-naphthoate polyprenyltransferase [Vagococcus]RHH68460.1 1,4-dihydroxy-2-naphthoate polyprenyltransferase [Vagococcus sp. AM17-17]